MSGSDRENLRHLGPQALAPNTCCFGGNTFPLAPWPWLFLRSQSPPPRTQLLLGDLF